MSLLKSFFWGMGVAAAAYIWDHPGQNGSPMLKSMEGASALAEKERARWKRRRNT